MWSRVFSRVAQAPKPSPTPFSRTYTSPPPPPLSPSPSSRSPLSYLLGATLFGATSLTLLAKYSDSSSFFHRNVTPFLFQSLPPETAHRLAILATSWGLYPNEGGKGRERERLMVDLWGVRFTNCLGVAAGFDKHAEAMEGLFAMGFGFVEVGSITPLPQPGNPTPRFFRLPADGAVINRYGFNSRGGGEAAVRLSEWRAKRGGAELLEGEDGGCTCEESIRSVVRESREILGVNLGKNKESVGGGDYILGLKNLGKYGDYVVVNVSSPNTKGLRDLQHKDALRALIKELYETRAEMFPDPKPIPAPSCFECRKLAGHPPPLLLKIAPDGLSLQDKKDIVDIINEFGVEGLIVCNTTISRPESLKSHETHPDVVMEGGGLSGKPLKEMSTKLIGEMYQLTEGKTPIVGVGGISNAEDAYEKIRNGATLVQVYTAFGYQGPALVPDIKSGLDELLKRDGYKNVQEAVGAAFKEENDNKQ